MNRQDSKRNTRGRIIQTFARPQAAPAAAERFAGRPGRREKTLILS
jgi:hypothetical protein